MQDIFRALSLLSPYKLKLSVIFIITLLLGIIEVLPAFIYKSLVDTITNNSLTPEIFKSVLLIALIYLVILAAQTLLNAMIRFYGNQWSMLIKYDLVRELSKNLFSIQQQYYYESSVGQILEKLRTGVAFVSQLFFDHVVEIITPLLTALLSIGILFKLDYRIGFIILLAVPFYFFFFKKAMDAINKYSPERRKAEEQIYGKMTEALYSIESTKVNSSPDHVLSYTKTFQDKAIEFYYQQQKQRGFWGALAGHTQDIVLVSSLVASAYLIYYGSFSIGDLVLVTALSTNLLTPIRRILIMQLDLKEALIGIRRLFEILDAPKESALFSGTYIYKRIQGKISFDSVTFGYHDDKKTLKNVSFEALPGTTLALVGPSGSGKTTITKLLSGLYVPNKGTIYVDDIPINTSDLTSLRKNIAVVFQDPFVFSDTIKNNLKFVKPHATNKEIDTVVSLSNMKEFIKDLPEGLDTQVGERGVKLSGGQKQRLAIAQALLKDAPIIIFDEATSSLDAENEKLIQEAMRRLMQNRTTIIISHRLATVIHADIILVLHNGKIIEQGKHRDLLALKGVYNKLYTLQIENSRAKDLL